MRRMSGGDRKARSGYKRPLDTTSLRLAMRGVGSSSVLIVLYIVTTQFELHFLYKQDKGE